ncbi:hypothetical protein [Parvibaculum sp.]|uniref:hypothetical protein n=1 Tax=Parvibaculum sp. TaxID=2024848 RepID=UPI000EC7C106|nr:hypothetical protein [Parvibaculum sp.]HAE55168.1 hypothetical protein [Acidimicrobiaceae bacterium]MBO6634867.1 hypothetical protein [Parvibaculum sp.]MBO6677993.1 hypothetical protein [Parvibaculum sp.]MBO6683326.1 hypothetical protein [Parvibaculum sp.]MBO6903594.1 hypothetical protein [Parvibaculum sp.]
MFARTATTRAEAWLMAAEHMQMTHEREYNVVLEILRPGLATPVSRKIEDKVDAFLRNFKAQPVHTVAETIFPAAEYLHGGFDAVYAYPESIFPFIKSENKWGTYALRLTERKCTNGKKIIPLELAIEKLKKRLKDKSTMRAIYELDLGMEALELKLYETEEDHNNYRGGQCLSHISLKLGPNRELYMTAVYRYQYYIQKALGNFLGLARLQAAIAHEVGIDVGPLVCHATLAVLEDKQFEQGVGWSRAQVSDLVESCKGIRDNEIVEAA